MKKLYLLSLIAFAINAEIIDDSDSDEDNDVTAEVVVDKPATSSGREQKPSFARCSYKAAEKAGLSEEFKAVKISQRDYSKALNKIDQKKREAFDKELRDVIEEQWKKFRRENNLTNDYEKVKKASDKFNSAYKALPKEKRSMLKSDMDDCRKEFPPREQE